MGQAEADGVQQRPVQDMEENNSKHQFRAGPEKQLCRKDAGEPDEPNH